MKLKWIALAAALLAASPVMASTCKSLGAMAPGYVAVFGNSFTDAQHFNDCYSFHLGNEADVVGVTVQWDWASTLNIALSSVSLTGAGIASSISDPTPQSFTFSDLHMGDYQLAIAGDVTGSGSEWGSVGYAGLITTTAPSIASPVPEPANLAMLGLGFGIVAWGVRRKA